jgi:hypothetical protein
MNQSWHNRALGLKCRSSAFKNRGCAAVRAFVVPDRRRALQRVLFRASPIPPVRRLTACAFFAPLCWGSERAVINANDNSAAGGFETKPAIMLLVAGERTRRMHTVPESYFEAFAVREPGRRTSRVWRFDRVSGESKLLGVGRVS